MSLIIFDEPITVLMAFGIVIIMGRVLLVELGSQAAQTDAEGATAVAR